MHIVHAISTLDLSHGGPVRAIIDLSAALAQLGHRVTVLTINDKDAPEDWKHEDGNPRVILLERGDRRGHYLSAKGKSRVASVFSEADVTHFHGIWWPCNTQFAGIARRLGKPYVISCRGMLDVWSMNQRKLKKLIYLRFARGTWMLNNATVIHCTAQGELEQSKRWFPKARGVVIPNLLNLEPFETMPGPELAHRAFPHFNQGEPVLLFLSRIHYKKGVEHLIRAVRLLVNDGTPHRLLIAGDGDKDYEARLRSLTTELGLDDRVAFLGLVVGELKISLFEAADVFVLPTSQENFGFVNYEALAAGTPLVTTKGVDTWPELQSEAGAVICDQRAEAIAGEVRKLTADPEALRKLGQHGREWIFSEMRPETISKNFETMYRESLETPRA